VTAAERLAFALLEDVEDFDINDFMRDVGTSKPTHNVQTWYRDTKVSTEHYARYFLAVRQPETGVFDGLLIEYDPTDAAIRRIVWQTKSKALLGYGYEVVDYPGFPEPIRQQIAAKIGIKESEEIDINDFMRSHDIQNPRGLPDEWYHDESGTGWVTPIIRRSETSWCITVWDNGEITWGARLNRKLINPSGIPQLSDAMEAKFNRVRAHILKHPHNPCGIRMESEEPDINDFMRDHGTAPSAAIGYWFKRNEPEAGVDLFYYPLWKTYSGYTGVAVAPSRCKAYQHDVAEHKLHKYYSIHERPKVDGNVWSQVKDVCDNLEFHLRTIGHFPGGYTGGHSPFTLYKGPLGIKESEEMDINDFMRQHGTVSPHSLESGWFIRQRSATDDCIVYAWPIPFSQNNNMLKVKVDLDNKEIVDFFYSRTQFYPDFFEPSSPPPGMTPEVRSALARAINGGLAWYKEDDVPRLPESVQAFLENDEIDINDFMRDQGTEGQKLLGAWWTFKGDDTTLRGEIFFMPVKEDEDGQWVGVFARPYDYTFGVSRMTKGFFERSYIPSDTPPRTDPKSIERLRKSAMENH
jgi:hypothetical protein